MSQGNQNIEGQPTQSQHTVIVVGKQKSVGVAFLLAFLFGPLGLLYASVTGGIVMLVLGIVIGIFTLGLGLVLVWIASLIWAVVASNNANRKSPINYSGVSVHQTKPIQQSTPSSSGPVAQDKPQANPAQATYATSARPSSSWVSENKKVLTYGSLGIIGVFVLFAGGTYIMNSGLGKGSSNEPSVGLQQANTVSNGQVSAPDGDVAGQVQNNVLLDTYIGTLGQKDFKLFIEKVDGDEVSGYNVTGTNRRPVKGRIVNKSRKPTGFGGDYTIFKVILTEPGDEEWDGEFNVDLWISDLTRHGEGSWRSFNGKLTRDIKIVDRYNN